MPRQKAQNAVETARSLNHVNTAHFELPHSQHAAILSDFTLTTLPRGNSPYAWSSTTKSNSSQWLANSVLGQSEHAKNSRALALGSLRKAPAQKYLGRRRLYR